MYLRAAAAAALALLISGDAVRLGWDAMRLWHFIFPYFWLFLLLEVGRVRGKNFLRQRERTPEPLAQQRVSLLCCSVECTNRVQIIGVHLRLLFLVYRWCPPSLFPNITGLAR